MKKTVFFFVSLLLTVVSFAQISKEVFSNADSKEPTHRFKYTKEKGYYSTMQVSLLMGDVQLVDRVAHYLPYQDFNYSTFAPDSYNPNTRTKMAVSPSVSVTGGFRLNKHWATGAGVGFEIFDTFLFPLFGEFRYTFLGKRISPFVTMKGGYAFGNFRQKHVDDLYLNWTPYYVKNAGLRNFGGMMFNPEVGVKVPMDENNDLLITAAFRYQKNKSVARKDYENGQFEEWEHREELNRLSIGIAILFKNL
jgi:hypothetical protein